jgi:hypothetical protein
MSMFVTAAEWAAGIRVEKDDGEEEMNKFTVEWLPGNRFYAGHGPKTFKHSVVNDPCSWDTDGSSGSEDTKQQGGSNMVGGKKFKSLCWLAAELTKIRMGDGDIFLRFHTDEYGAETLKKLLGAVQVQPYVPYSLKADGESFREKIAEPENELEVEKGIRKNLRRIYDKRINKLDNEISELRSKNHKLENENARFRENIRDNSFMPVSTEEMEMVRQGLSYQQIYHGRLKKIQELREENEKWLKLVAGRDKEIARLHEENEKLGKENAAVSAMLKERWDRLFK